MVLSTKKARLNCVKTGKVRKQPVTVQQNLSSSAETDKGMSDHSDVLVAIAFLACRLNSPEYN